MDGITFGAMHLNETNPTKNQMSQLPENLLIEGPLSGDSNSIFKCKLKEVDYAVKKIALSDSATVSPVSIESQQEEWQILRCENLVSYHHNFIKDSFR